MMTALHTGHHGKKGYGIIGWEILILQWRHNERDGVSNHRRHDRLLNPLFRRKSKKTSKLRVTGLCEGNSPMTGEFPSNTENVSIWWRHLISGSRLTPYLYSSNTWMSGWCPVHADKVCQTGVGYSWSSWCRNSSGRKTEPGLNARLESLNQTGCVAGLRLVSGMFWIQRFNEGSKFQRPILYCLVSRFLLAGGYHILASLAGVLAGVSRR